MSEKSVLRWGGLAGMVAGFAFILEAIILSSFVATGGYLKFPDVQAAIGVGNLCDFVSFISWVVLLVVLYRTLRGANLAPALFGSVLAVLGAAVFIAGTGQTAVFARISDLDHAPGTTPVDQATLALIWQATRAIFNSIETVGGLLLMIGVIALGLAMLRAPAFGKRYGAMSVAFGGVGAVGIAFFEYGSSGQAVFDIPIIVILPIVLGWKVYSLSRAA